MNLYVVSIPAGVLQVLKFCNLILGTRYLINVELTGFCYISMPPDLCLVYCSAGYQDRTMKIPTSTVIVVILSLCQFLVS